MPQRACISVVVLGAAALASTAHAGFYAGASYVQTDSEFETAVDEFEADDSSFKVFAGFTFLKFLGVEASYRDLGKHSDSGGAGSVDVDLTAIDLSARGILPLGRVVSLFAKVGYANIQSDGDIDVDEWEPLYGAGIDIHLLKWIGVRAEWEEYDIDESLNSLSVGAFFRF